MATCRVSDIVSPPPGVRPGRRSMCMASVRPRAMARPMPSAAGGVAISDGLEGLEHVVPPVRWHAGSVVDDVEQHRVGAVTLGFDGGRLLCRGEVAGVGDEVREHALEQATVREHRGRSSGTSTCSAPGPRPSSAAATISSSVTRPMWTDRAPAWMRDIASRLEMTSLSRSADSSIVRSSSACSSGVQVRSRLPQARHRRLDAGQGGPQVVAYGRQQRGAHPVGLLESASLGGLLAEYLLVVGASCRGRERLEETAVLGDHLGAVGNEDHALAGSDGEAGHAGGRRTDRGEHRAGVLSGKRHRGHAEESAHLVQDARHRGDAGLPGRHAGTTAEPPARGAPRWLGSVPPDRR